MRAQITISKTYCVELASDDARASVFEAERFARALSVEEVEDVGSLIDAATTRTRIVCDSENVAPASTD